MKKSLIALAALAVVSAASAQTSSLTISGYIDRGFTDTSNTDSTKNSRVIGSSAGTTSIFVKGTEDIGGGNVVGFSVESDWAEFGGATQTAAFASAQKAGFANGESFASLASATLGTLKLGAPNSFTLGNVTGVASPAFSTGVGSAYSSKFSIANGISTGLDGYAGTASLNAQATSSASNVGSRAIRIANTIQYVSPVFSGFSVGLGYAAQNNNAITSAGNTNTVGVTEYALNYTNGPIVAAFTSIKYETGSNGVNQFTLTPVASTATLISTQKAIAGGLSSTQNMLGATYTVLPNFKLHAGFGSFSSSDNANKGTSSQVGVTYVIGNIDLMAQYAKVNDSSVTNADRKIFGLGANYNLSKTARVYFRYEDANFAASQVAYSGSEIKRTAVGVSKSF